MKFSSYSSLHYYNMIIYWQRKQTSTFGGNGDVGFDVNELP